MLPQIERKALPLKKKAPFDLQLLTTFPVCDLNESVLSRHSLLVPVVVSMGGRTRGATWGASKAVHALFFTRNDDTSKE